MNTNLSEIIKTPEDAMRLLNERKAQHQELVDAAHAAFDAYFADIERRGDRLVEQVKQLDQQRASVVATRSAAQQALVSATVDGDDDAMRTEQDRIGQLSAQLAALDAQIAALNEYVLQGDTDLFHAAETAIRQAREDSEAMAADVEAVKNEVAQRLNAWNEVLHSYVGTGELPNMNALYNHATETVAERATRLDLEVQEQEERRLAWETQEARLREEEEERARRNKEPKPNPVCYAQVNGRIIKQVWNGSTGQYDDVGPVARRSVFS